MENNFFKISLAGDLGSGKSTVGAILKDKFNAEIISIGKIQRAMASELNMDTCEFNKYQETHPEFDKILDGKLADYEEKQGNYIFDSRMAWHFVPSAFSVYLACDGKEAAKRVIQANRQDETYTSVDEAYSRLLLRRQREQKRYHDFYNVDITDMSNYQLVVDTTGKTPEEVAEEVISGWQNR
ncbi:MAG: cytidylate kinase family protein [Clostridia bacterium]|nr:cytidylate kinase family protein [Clostridia bacterium]